MKLTAAIRIAREKNKVPLIAEIKMYSPKDGDLLRGRDPVAVVRQYEKAGACAVSVVTEVEHFKGNIRILVNIRKETQLPIFQKDFFTEPKQLEAIKNNGADAILLIASMLSKERLNELNEYAHQLDLETVVEIHDEEDLRKLVNIDSDIVGINNKDILILEKDEDRIQPTLDLIDKVRRFPWILSESGIRSLDDLRKVLQAGADAVLMGTKLLTVPDIMGTIDEIIHIDMQKTDHFKDRQG